MRLSKIGSEGALSLTRNLTKDNPDRAGLSRNVFL